MCKQTHGGLEGFDLYGWEQLPYTYTGYSTDIISLARIQQSHSTDLAKLKDKIWQNSIRETSDMEYIINQLLKEVERNKFLKLWEILMIELVKVKTNS